MDGESQQRAINHAGLGVRGGGGWGHRLGHSVGGEVRGASRKRGCRVPWRFPDVLTGTEGKTGAKQTSPCEPQKRGG